MFFWEADTGLEIMHDLSVFSFQSILFFTQLNKFVPVVQHDINLCQSFLKTSVTANILFSVVITLTYKENV